MYLWWPDIPLANTKQCQKDNQTPWPVLNGSNVQFTAGKSPRTYCMVRNWLWALRIVKYETSELSHNAATLDDKQKGLGWQRNSSCDHSTFLENNYQYIVVNLAGQILRASETGSRKFVANWHATDIIPYTKASHAKRRRTTHFLLWR